MKRLKVILALALALGIMVTISVAPALANNNNNNNRLERKDLQLDRAILNELRDDNNGCCDHDFRFDNDFRFDHDNDCCDDDDIDFVGFNHFGFNNFNCGHWEWSWVFDRWDWEDDCD